MPLDLLSTNDPILAGLPREFLDRFDAAAVSRRLSPWIVRQPRFSAAKLAVAEWLRQGWCKQGSLTECRVINDARYQAVCRVLDEEFRPLEIAWAIVAYGRECLTEKARVDNPLMRRSFEAFILQALERYIPLGQKLQHDEAARRRRVGERKVQHQAQTTCDGLLAEWNRLEAAEQRSLLDEAVKRLAVRNIYAGPTEIGNPMLRGKVLQILQERMKKSGRTPVPVGQVVDQALSA